MSNRWINSRNSSGGRKFNGHEHNGRYYARDDREKGTRDHRHRHNRRQDYHHSTKYYRRRSRSLSPLEGLNSSDDSDIAEGKIEVKKGDLFDNRYQVLRVAGQGTFGTVFECLDRKYEEIVAVKAVRSIRRYLEAAEVEIDILDRIRQEDREKNSLCVKLLNAFEAKHRGQRHMFLVFEKLGRSLYTFIKGNGHLGYPLYHVQHFAFQLLKSINFCHSIGLIHTDLKPENILLVDDSYVMDKLGNNEVKRLKNTHIRLIDFGGATWDKDHHSSIINTRQYRSPEVILGLGWSYPSDMWSVGCILAELYTGKLLFSTHDDLEHLALMERILERKIPQSLCGQALQIAENNDKMRRKRRDGHSRRSSSVPRPEQLLSCKTLEIMWPGQADKESVDYVKNEATLSQLIADQDFLDLLRKMLRYSPVDRISSREALSHPFLRKYIC